MGRFRHTLIALRILAGALLITGWVVLNSQAWIFLADTSVGGFAGSLATTLVLPILGLGLWTDWKNRHD